MAQLDSLGCGPTITDNQTGDDTWRNTNSGTYDVDFSDATALASFATRVHTAAALGGTMRQDWTQVAAIGGTSYTTNWAVLASTWTAMQEGTNYVSVRVTSSGAQSTILQDAFYVRKDTVAPPAVTTTAATSPTTSQPALTWTTVTDATSGTSYYRVYRGASSTGPWTKINTDGATTTGSYTDTTAPWGTSYYKVQAVDAATNEQATGANVISVTYHRAPTVTLQTPVDTATGQSTIPTLVARHDDLDGNTGTISFELCPTSACASTVATGSSSAGVAAGANGSWVVSTTLAQGTQYWWRARTTDSLGVSSAWSSVWSFTTSTGPAITDNQVGDTTWRSAGTTTYDVDFSDPVGLASFDVRVYSGAGSTGSLLVNWTQVAGSLPGTAYTTNWALPAGVWTGLQEGVNYIHVRATNDSAGSSILVDAFTVYKDTTAAAPTGVLDGTAADVAWWPSTSAMSANWTGSTGEAGLSGVLRYEYCVSTGASCSGTIALGWTNGTAAASFTGATMTTAMSNGVQYFVHVRMRDGSAPANVSAVATSNGFRPDVSAPAVPLLQSPTNAAALTATPTLQARYDDQTVVSPGSIEFRVTSNSGCTTIVDSGSSATGLADLASGTWTPGALTAGSYWWCARAVDGAGNASAWATAFSFTLNYAPQAVTLISPNAAQWVADSTPQLTARFNDSDGASTGQLEFEVCATDPGANWLATCGITYESGSSSAGIANGANGNWSPATALPNGSTYSWRARGVDQGALAGPWATSRTVRIDTAPPNAVTTLAAPSPTNAAPALSWSTVTDAESGTAYYRVYRSTAPGTLGSQINVDSATTTGSFADSGVSSGTYFYTVRAVDQVGNERALGNNQIEVSYTASLYFRTTTASALTGAWQLQHQAGSGADAATGAKISNDAAPTHWQFTPGALNATNAGATQPTGPDGRGWIFEAAPGTSHQAGTWRVHMTTDATHSHSGFVRARVWKVTLSGNSLGASPVSLSSGWVEATTDTGSNLTLQSYYVDVPMPNVSFAAGEYLYVELFQRVATVASGGGTANARVDLQVNTATERIEPTGPLAPSATPSSPSNGATGVSFTPALQASYTHPSATAGNVIFQLCSNATCSSLVDSTTSGVTASGATATWNVGTTLSSGTQYWWRTRATDTGGITGGWSSIVSFTTNSGPSIIDNQVGDDTWRNSNSGTYNVDFTDATALSSFATRVHTAAAMGGTMRQDWTQVAAIGGSSYTTNWGVLASTWTAMQEGVNYVSVRVTNTGAQTTTLQDAFYVRKDTVAPPAVTTTAASSPTTSQPALTWTTVTDATSGTSYYRVYRGASSTGPWTKINTDGATTSGSYTDTTAPWGTSYYKVQAVDAATNEQATGANVISVLYHRTPTVPTLASPADTAIGVALAPTLSASYSDPDGTSGTVYFEVCTDSGCSATAATGTSGATSSGSNATWVVSPALSPGTQYWYRARATDTTGATSGWSSIFTFTTNAGPTIIDNQAGDTTWRSTGATPYNVDFTDVVALASFDVRAYSAAAGGGSLLVGWTQVATISGTSYTTNWALPAGVWSALQEGVNYIHVRANNSAASSTIHADVFTVYKDTQAAAPSGVLDGTGSDVAWWPSVTAMSANWTGSTGETGMSGVLRYEYCISTGAGCTGTKALDWTNGTTTASFTNAAATLLNGATYFVHVRMRDNSAPANVSANASSNGFTVDASPPATPLLQSPTNAAALTSTPTLQARYDDQTTVSPGSLEFRVASNAACTTVVDSGASATGLADLASGTWTPGALAAGSYWWCARAIDGAGNTSSWATAFSFTLNYAPQAATLISPNAAQWVAHSTPALTARFNDTDAAATGQLEFEVCATDPGATWSGTCGPTYQTGTSSSGILDGANGSWSPSTALVNGATYSWRARGIDQGSLAGPWATSRTVKIDTAPPNAITTLAATTPTTTPPALTWNTVTDAESGTSYYRVYRSATSGTLGTQINVDSATTTGSFTDSTGVGSGSWYYTVRAVDQVGNERTLGNDQISVEYTAPLYLRNAAAAGTGTWQITRQPGAASDTSSSPRIARGTGYTQFQAGVTSSTASFVGTLPATPSGGGWLYDPADGEQFAAGTWRHNLTTNAQRTHTGYVNVRAWKVTLSGGTIATPTAISTWTQGTTDAGATQNSNIIHAIDVTTNAVTFAAGEYLYVEYWENVTVASGFNNTNISLQAETADDRIEPTAPPPSMSIDISVLGRSDAARDESDPFAIDFGTITPGTSLPIGPTGSGQTLAGPAVSIDVTTGENAQLMVNAADWSDGTTTMPAGSLGWRPYTDTGAWTAMTTADAPASGTIAPGSSTIEYELQLTPPSTQPAGNYSTTVTYTIVPDA